VVDDHVGARARGQLEDTLGEVVLAGHDQFVEPQLPTPPAAPVTTTGPRSGAVDIPASRTLVGRPVA
jgi:hypothetical protein